MRSRTCSSKRVDCSGGSERVSDFMSAEHTVYFHSTLTSQQVQAPRPAIDPREPRRRPYPRDTTATMSQQQPPSPRPERPSRSTGSSPSQRVITEPAHANTHVVKRLRPSQAGALKLARRYGDALVCVRYRHNAQGTYRYTTIELVVDEAPVETRAHLDELVMIRIAFDDTKRRHRALAEGALWDVKRQLWSMPRRTAKRLRLITSIVKR